MSDVGPRQSTKRKARSEQGAQPEWRAERGGSAADELAAGGPDAEAVAPGLGRSSGGRSWSGRRGYGASGSGGSEAESAGDPAAAGGGDEAAARRIALDALSRTARTRGQLEGLLKKKGIASEAADAVLDRFEEVGLIDDVDYAEAFVESRHRLRGQGGRALSMELRRRGVADDVVAEAVGGLSPEREFETAFRIARSRYERMLAVPSEVKVRRLAGFLARKGYSGAIVARAVREVVATADSAAMEAAEALEGAEALDAMDGTEGEG